ncbi:xanthine dehydrogenase family protein molybdopterin-binding subunit [Enterovirga sp.]|uniref:xanthine dehydrogenase family protein molybdopterin-binding subunit n=1 Tax=Enterovirga sp. TaxID=2026350 RepID=UPI00260EFBAC|nr:xanthine dehydrogenase family protein molybdopterin-binding subunit [Enterovirga sp.]MDB5591753.1 carbon monoxide dehydrogenase [Enterovirga sp.]
MRVKKFGVGQAVNRVEDARLVTGGGRYTDDIAPEGALHAYVLRSPYAHAGFRIGDLAPVAAMPGVKLILTHRDLGPYGTLPCGAPVTNQDGRTMTLPAYPLLADRETHHVGDAVAFVVAETPIQARDAAEAIPVTWEPKAAVVGIRGAEAAGAPLVFPSVPGNLAFDTALGDGEAVDAAFARAARTVSLTLVNNRLVTNYMEGRACIGEYDRAAGRWTLTFGGQGVHGIKGVLADAVLKVEPERLHVKTPDVGGGFGTKYFPYREYPLAMIAAERLGAPVRWTADRSEHFVGDAQGRDNIATLEMALDAANRFTALRVDLKADMGGYLNFYAPFIPAASGAPMSPGLYDIPAAHIRIRGYYTHTLPVDAYRGAGRPEAAYAIERFVDYIAGEVGMEPDALRSLNFIPKSRIPYRTATGNVYDSGDFEGHMRAAMARADWAGFPARRAASARAGKLRGIGLASYVEACAGGSGEQSIVRLEPDGDVTVLIGTQSNGQGHETAYAQLVSQELDLPLHRIHVVQGDSDRIATGGGTGGSRSLPVGGASVAGASKGLAEKLKRLAGDRLEAGMPDLELVDGAVRVVGTDRAVDIAALAEGAAAEDLASDGDWTPPAATFPNGTHVVEVEVDPETGVVDLVSYVVVDDFGVTLNPKLLAGQVHGGIAQGIGQALFERTVYDPEGQLVTASFMDYRMPRAADFPDIRFETRNVPCETNALGLKGAGEAGAIGSCPAVMNALADALSPFGIRHIDMPATPDVVWAAIEAAGPRARAAE